MATTPTSLRVRLLGGFVVEGLTDASFGSRKVRLLAKVLALGRGQPVSQDQLIEVLWGDATPGQPHEQLGVLVSRLRHVVGATRLVRREGGYVAMIDWLDVDELDDRVREATSACAQQRWGAARAAAESALALARGPLLPEDEGAWVEAERALCASLVGRAHLLVAESAGASGDPVGAAAAAELALRHDPYDEKALRILMHAHRQAGRPASGLAAYARVREQLATDMGVSPSAETEALHDELVLGAPAPAPGLRRRPPSSDAVAPDALGALVGRGAPIADLDRAFAAACRGDAVAVLIEGEPGIGKTTMVESWLRTVTDRATVLLGRCDELGRDLPLQPLADALQAHLRTLGPRQVHELLGAEAEELFDLLDLGRTISSVTSAVDPETGRTRLFVALLAVVERLDDRPVVVVIEDVHDAGRSTIAWMSFAMRRGTRLLLIATRRPLGPDLPGARRIALGPLAAEDVAVIAQGRNVDELYERSGGNPLLLLALLDAPPGALPGSVREAAERQVAALGAAGMTLRTAAVLGHAIDLDLLADVLDRPAVSVLADLELAARIGLLVDRDGYEFRHAVIREALEATVGSARRSLAHREAARVLRDRRPVDLLAVAVHSRLGGDVSSAIVAFVDAAAVALRRFDLVEAMSHLDAALELGPTAAALALRAQVRMVGGDLETAAIDAASAIALDGGPAALEIAAWVAYYRRRYDEARVFADRGAQRSDGQPALRTSCLAVAGRVLHGAGDLASSTERLQGELGAPLEVQGVADVWLAHVRVHEGRPDDALGGLARAMVEPDRLAHPWAALHGRLVQIMALGQRGQIVAALAAAEELEAVAARAGAPAARFAAIAANGRSWLLRAVGQWSAANEQNERALGITSGPAGQPTSESFAEPHWVALLDLADGAVVTGDLATASAYLSKLGPVDQWSGTMAWHQRHRLDLLRARVVLAGGDRVRAAELAAGVVNDAGRRGAQRYRLLARAVEALADPTIPVSEVSAVIDGLARCAVPEGWRLVAALADRYDIDGWRVEAATRGAQLVSGAGPQADNAARMISAVLDR